MTKVTTKASVGFENESGIDVLKLEYKMSKCQQSLKTATNEKSID